jgi:hypothetical protein
MKALIYYGKLMSPTQLSGDSKWFHDVYMDAHHSEVGNTIKIPINKFKQYWALMGSEDVQGEDYGELERLFSKYNSDDGNPLGTDAGQQKVRVSGTHHTSMSVLDIIKIGTKYYMVAGQGWKIVEMKK